MQGLINVPCLFLCRWCWFWIRQAVNTYSLWLPLSQTALSLRDFDQSASRTYKSSLFASFFIFAARGYWKMKDIKVSCPASALMFMYVPTSTGLLIPNISYQHLVASREHGADLVTFTSAASHQLKFNQLDSEFFPLPNFKLEEKKNLSSSSDFVSLSVRAYVLVDKQLSLDYRLWYLCCDLMSS
jgi:hypothetical protein